MRGGASGGRLCHLCPGTWYDLGMSDLSQLIEDGHKDYIGLPLNFMGRTAGGLGLSTRHPEGFTDDQLNQLRAAALN